MRLATAQVAGMSLRPIVAAMVMASATPSLGALSVPRGRLRATPLRCWSRCSERLSTPLSQLPSRSAVPRLSMREGSRHGIFATVVSVSLVLGSAQPAFAAVAARHAMLPKKLSVVVAMRACALLSAWIAFSLKRAGPKANPERRRAGQPIKCPWPFVLVAAPWTDLGRRSLRAGFCDWQTWAALSVGLLLA